MHMSHFMPITFSPLEVLLVGTNLLQSLCEVWPAGHTSTRTKTIRAIILLKEHQSYMGYKSRRKPWTCHDDAMIYMSDALYCTVQGSDTLWELHRLHLRLAFLSGVKLHCKSRSLYWGILWLLGFAAHFGRDAVAGRCKDSHPYKNRKSQSCSSCPLSLAALCS